MEVSSNVKLFKVYARGREEKGWGTVRRASRSLRSQSTAKIFLARNHKEGVVNASLTRPRDPPTFVHHILNVLIIEWRDVQVHTERHFEWFRVSIFQGIMGRSPSVAPKVNIGESTKIIGRSSVIIANKHMRSFTRRMTKSLDAACKTQVIQL